jgi:tRNA U34 5-methylaminomethyl-2-thiouridine-forming methyltransferase MnmC
MTPAALAFRDDGTLFSPLHEDIYHSAAGAIDQACFVFLKGNGLPERWRMKSRFTILEAGFGLGINFLATWAAWRNDPQRSDTLDFVSIEKHPFSADDLRRAHAAILDDESITPLANSLVQAWPALSPGMHRIEFETGALHLTLVFGDIAEALVDLGKTEFNGDALFLDGFAPSKNPDMWTPEIFMRLASLSRGDATFATYTSSGHVKRALLASGFYYRKVRGFGGKRAMLVGSKSLDSKESIS